MDKYLCLKETVKCFMNELLVDFIQTKRFKNSLKIDKLCLDNILVLYTQITKM